jgi:glycosyltransferase involved in cell wall biosynthesis
MNKQKISVIIPVYNEEESIAKVLDEIPQNYTDVVLVIDNGSTDQSAQIARESGAMVLNEPQRGYGAACLKGIEYLKTHNPPDILVFMDGDYSDYPGEMVQLIQKINEGYDFVLGSRVLGVKHFNAVLPPHSVIGNKIAAFFLNVFFSGDYTDLGPFRAIKFNRLLELNMCDKNYGWTIEMQIKADRKKLSVTEIPVHYRKRYAGQSKVTGNFWGSTRALFKISYVLILYYLRIR